jgi:translation initiation factor 3 subunit I
MPVRPYLLKGHDRPVTMIKFSPEGDIMFTSSKGKQFAAWWTKNGERIGTYNGHNGSVWAIDVTRDTKLVLSASADTTARLWDAATGKELVQFQHIAPVRCCGLSEKGDQFFTINDRVMGKQPTIRIFDIAEDPRESNVGSRKEFECQGEHKVLAAAYGPDDETIFTACEDGTVRVYDLATGKQTKVIADHKKPVMGLQFNADRSLFVTASKDGFARLFDARTFENLKTYNSGRPINTAALSPLKRHVLVAGGQEASTVTTTRVDPSQFHTAVYHMAHEKEIAALPGHFGPVNYVCWNPDGQAFATGGEDGFVRYNPLSEDEEYMNDKLDKTFADHFAASE